MGKQGILTLLLGVALGANVVLACWIVSITLNPTPALGGTVDTSGSEAHEEPQFILYEGAQPSAPDFYATAGVALQSTNVTLGQFDTERIAVGNAGELQHQQCTGQQCEHLEQHWWRLAVATDHDGDEK